MNLSEPFSNVNQQQHLIAVLNSGTSDRRIVKFARVAHFRNIGANRSSFVTHVPAASKTCLLCGAQESRPQRAAIYILYEIKVVNLRLVLSVDHEVVSWRCKSQKTLMTAKSSSSLNKAKPLSVLLQQSASPTYSRRR